MISSIHLHETECNQSDWWISVSNNYIILKSSAGLWKKQKEKTDVAISSVCASYVYDFLSCLELIVWYSLLIFMSLSPKCSIDIPLWDHEENSTWVAKSMSRISLSYSFHVTKSFWLKDLVQQYNLVTNKPCCEAQ